MSEGHVISLGRLLEALKKGEVDKLREELSKAEKVLLLAYRLPRPQKLRVRAHKKLVDLNPGVLSKLEYALLKSVAEAVKSNRLPTFKDVAELASDYKAVAKYLEFLSEAGVVVFADPAKAAKLAEANRALSESKYKRRISKVLDLPIVLNIQLLEERASKVPCKYSDGRLVCGLYSEGPDREQDKVQLALLNEYLAAK